MYQKHGKQAMAAEAADDYEYPPIDKHKRGESMLLNNNKGINNVKISGHNSVLASYNKGSLPQENSTSPLSLTRTQARQDRAKLNQQ